MLIYREFFEFLCFGLLLLFFNFVFVYRFELDLGPEASGDTDIDYYNDLPGKVPPDVASSDAGPPPVPPLPTVTKPPFTTLPPVQSPNLIDFSAEPLPFSEFAHHDYVNEKFGHSSRERDVFDMRKFRFYFFVVVSIRN